jgi:hypothetical protein
MWRKAKFVLENTKTLIKMSKSLKIATKAIMDYPRNTPNSKEIKHSFS